MSKRVFDARSAPEEEIQGVRAALDEAGIQYYETRAGNWGFGSAGLWVYDAADHERARALINDFQISWVEQARSQREPPPIRWSMLPPLAVFVGLLTWAFWSLLKALGG
ncbi:MAG: DUF6164 family protein [Pseudomonadota bacterium]